MHDEICWYLHIAEQDEQYWHDDDAAAHAKQPRQKPGKNSGKQQGRRHHQQQIRRVKFSVVQYLWPLSDLGWALPAPSCLLYPFGGGLTSIDQAGQFAQMGAIHLTPLLFDRCCLPLA